MARTEVRKECPSCGLGVPLDAKVCEFCGWDFEEEDEWISQIEKLEQELITEKQKFDDTVSDRMIQSTLHAPTLEKTDEEAGARPPVMKKAAAQGEFKVRIVAPMEERLAEGEILAEAEKAAKPAAEAAKSKSMRISVSKIPSSPEEDIELELKDELDLELKEDEKPKPEEKEKMIAEPSPARPVAPAQATRKVRRVVTRASQEKAIPTATPPVRAKPATEKQMPEKAKAPAPEVQKAAPTAPAKAAAAPPKEEKKSLFGGFGKMFSVSVPVQQKKPEAKPTPSKAPAKAAPAAPAKAPTTVKVFVCPLCNKEVNETEKKCPNCGAEFE